MVVVLQIIEVEAKVFIVWFVGKCLLHWSLIQPPRWDPHGGLHGRLGVQRVEGPPVLSPGQDAALDLVGELVMFEDFLGRTVEARFEFVFWEAEDNN